MNRFTQYSVEQSGQPKGWLLVSRKAGSAYESRKIRPDLLGVPGAQGLPGINGAPGQPGAKGEVGLIGNSGPQGDAGLPGPNGAAGVYSEEVTLWDSAAFDSFEQYAAAAPVSGLNGGLGFITPWAGFGASIVTRINADGTTEKRLSIASGWIARRFPWGSNWNAIEICFNAWINRPALTNFGDVESGGAQYFVGACSGQVNTAASALCENFIGLKGQSEPTFVYTVGTQNNYFVNTGRTTGSKVLGVFTFSSPSVGSSFPVFSAVEGRKSIQTFRIDRSAFIGGNSANYTMVLGNGTVSAEYDYPKQTLMESYARRVNLSENLPGGLTAQTATQVWNESTGQLDSLNIVWPWTTPLELSAVSVRRVY